MTFRSTKILVIIDIRDFGVCIESNSVVLACLARFDLARTSRIVAWYYELVYTCLTCWVCLWSSARICCLLLFFRLIGSVGWSSRLESSHPLHYYLPYWLDPTWLFYTFLGQLFYTGMFSIWVWSRWSNMTYLRPSCFMLPRLSTISIVHCTLA